MQLVCRLSLIVLSLLVAVSMQGYAQGGKPAEKPPQDRKSTRLNSSHLKLSRMPSSA